jgi:hypothetical protein
MSLYTFAYALKKPNGPLDISYPFANEFNDSQTLEIRQSYKQALSGYAPLPLNTPFNSGECNLDGISSLPPQITGARFVGDLNETIEGGRTKTWDRVWATIPQTQTGTATLSYTFPGYKFNNGFADSRDGYLNIREAPTYSVNAKLIREYYMVGSGTAYSGAFQIPTVSRQEYINTFGSQGTAPGDFVLSSAFGGFSSDPTLATYTGWVSAGTEIVADDSTLNPYKGNIWMRETPYVKAR